MVTISPPSILLADDDERVRSSLAALAQSVGWRCEVSSGGTHLLSHAAKNEFDLIITDLLIPGIDGLHLFHEIQETAPASQVVVLTEGDIDGPLVELLRRGVVHCLRKPCESDGLEQALSRILHHTTRERWNRAVYRSVEFEHTKFQFLSRELGFMTPPLPVLDRLVECGTITHHERLKIWVAFEEAVANALDHGNLELLSVWKDEIGADGGDLFTVVKRERLQDVIYGQRRVTIEVKLTPLELEISVADEGPGFSGGQTSDSEKFPLLPTACHGRGIAMITSSMDEVWYSRGGRRVTMLKKLSTS